MDISSRSGPRRPATATRFLARSLVVVAVCVLLLGVGAAVADADAGDEGRSCPGENPNVGYEHASPQGAASSLPAIANAFQRIGCPG